MVFLGFSRSLGYPFKRFKGTISPSKTPAQVSGHSQRGLRGDLAAGRGIASGNIHCTTGNSGISLYIYMLISVKYNIYIYIYM